LGSPPLIFSQAGGRPTLTNKLGEKTPRGERRLIYYHSKSGLWEHFFPNRQIFSAGGYKRRGVYTTTRLRSHSIWGTQRGQSQCTLIAGEYKAKYQKNYSTQLCDEMGAKHRAGEPWCHHTAWKLSASYNNYCERGAAGML